MYYPLAFWTQDFDSDLCLKSSKQQSQQAMGTEIDHYEYCQQASELQITAVFVWRGWTPPPCLWSWPFFHTISKPLAQRVRLCLISEVFRVNIISPLEFKLFFSALNSTLITLLPALHFGQSSSTTSSPQTTQLTLPINFFNPNVCCSSSSEWRVLEKKLELSISITRSQTTVL